MSELEKIAAENKEVKEIMSDIQKMLGGRIVNED